MTPHDWKFVHKDFLWRSVISDTIIIVDNAAKVGSFICSRCSDKAHVIEVSWPEARVTSNWRSDCDESVIKKVHEL